MVARCKKTSIDFCSNQSKSSHFEISLIPMKPTFSLFEKSFLSEKWVQYFPDIAYTLCDFKISSFSKKIAKNQAISEKEVLKLWSQIEKVFTLTNHQEGVCLSLRGLMNHFFDQPNAQKELELLLSMWPKTIPYLDDDKMLKTYLKSISHYTDATAYVAENPYLNQQHIQKAKTSRANSKSLNVSSLFETALFLKKEWAAEALLNHGHPIVLKGHQNPQYDNFWLYNTIFARNNIESSSLLLYALARHHFEDEKPVYPYGQYEPNRQPVLLIDLLSQYNLVPSWREAQQKALAMDEKHILEAATPLAHLPLNQSTDSEISKSERPVQRRRSL